MIRHEGIHHVSLIVTDLERSKRFYEEVIGLREIQRPPFDFPGAWYGIGDGGQQLHLLVHVGETLRGGGIDTRDGHFAIRVADFDETIAWLDRCGIEHRHNRNSITGFSQIFLLDPDRNIIELNAARE
ncbi:glyoxalase [Paenibacillus lycopersici]|uniref:Glyoxalase n=1 Tax=Paenibacillus lycopersici TaxID=2704462 RepID=A0A6C0FPJ3_9BACL|nr:VOC family protein [Paenibacillus lycopersici]QHT59046.1 glyoxalase [Paenibacillus lycopersici]